MIWVHKLMANKANAFTVQICRVLTPRLVSGEISINRTLKKLDLFDRIGLQPITDYKKSD